MCSTISGRGGSPPPPDSISLSDVTYLLLVPSVDKFREVRPYEIEELSPAEESALRAELSPMQEGAAKRWARKEHLTESASPLKRWAEIDDDDS